MTNSDGSGEYPLKRSGRMLLVAWSLFLLGGFVLAFCLEPAPQGYGTHQKLGLPPCTFRALVGRPCPSCGMTTSFSHFVRGEFRKSVRTNAAGCLLATFCVLQIPWCWWSVFRGRLYGITDPERAGLVVLSSFFGICALNWLLLLAFA